ncbi:MAG: endonuclease III [Ignavibacteria bacterium]|nr:endonuclease III [Bacteroidota bacterium]MSQ45398.1 endonuclease III [Ignavibacteria bacterium]
MKYFTLADLKRETELDKKKRAAKIILLLKKKYKSPKTALQYINPLQLLISVMLSAQCTDIRVNLVTPNLFIRYKTVSDFSNADQRELERIIFSTGFYRNKAKNIIACCKKIESDFNFEVPSTMVELISLPGVGRKTANCVLSEHFKKVEGIVVDTHVLRISKRLGFSKYEDAVKAEIDLMELLNKKYWLYYGSVLISHGRELCKARTPLCAECNLKYLCPSNLI